MRGKTIKEKAAYRRGSVRVLALLLALSMLAGLLPALATPAEAAGGLTAVRAWKGDDDSQTNILSWGSISFVIDGYFRTDQSENSSENSVVVELRNDSSNTISDLAVMLTGSTARYYKVRKELDSTQPSPAPEITEVAAGDTFRVYVEPSKEGLPKGLSSMNLRVSGSDGGNDVWVTIPIYSEHWVYRQGHPVLSNFSGRYKFIGEDWMNGGDCAIYLSPETGDIVDLSGIKWDGTAPSTPYEKVDSIFGDAYNIYGDTLELWNGHGTGQIGQIYAKFHGQESQYIHNQDSRINIYYVDHAPLPLERTVIIPSDTDTTVDLNGSVISDVTQTQGLDGVTLGTDGQVTVAAGTSKGGEAHFNMSITDDNYVNEELSVTVYLLEKQAPQTLPDINVVAGQVPNNKIELPAIAGAAYEITSGGSLVSGGMISPDSDGKYYVTLPSNLNKAGRITVTMTVPAKYGENGEYKTEAVTTQNIVVRKPAEFTGTFLYEYTDATKPAGAVTMNAQIFGATVTYTLKSGGEILKNYSGGSQFRLAKPTVYGKAVITATSTETSIYAAGSRDIEIYVRQPNPAAASIPSEHTVIIPSATDIAPIDLTGGIAGATVAQTQGLAGVTLGENGQVTVAKDTAKGGAAKFTVSVPASDEYEAAEIPVTIYLLEKRAPRTLEDIDLVAGRIASNKIELPAIEGATYEITDGDGLVSTGAISPDGDGKHYVTLPDSVTDAAQITVTITAPNKKGEGGEYKAETVNTQRIMIRKEAEFTGTFLYEYTDSTKPDGAVTLDAQVPGAGMTYTLKNGGEILKDYNNVNHFTLTDAAVYGKAVITATSGETDTYIAGSRDIEIYVRKPAEFTGTFLYEYTDATKPAGAVTMNAQVPGADISYAIKSGGEILKNYIGGNQFMLADPTAYGKAVITVTSSATDTYAAGSRDIEVYVRKPSDDKSKPSVSKNKNGDFIITGLVPNANYDLAALSQKEFKEDLEKNYFTLSADGTGKIVIAHDSQNYKTLELDQAGANDVLIRRSKTDDMLPSDLLPTSHGVTVSGVVNVFSPNCEGQVMLYPYNADGSEPEYYELHHTVYDTEYKCTFGGASEPKNSGAAPVNFKIEKVPAGTYLLVVVKPGSLHFVVKNLVVGSENIDLTGEAYPETVRSMNVLPGDLNGNGLVETGDSAALFHVKNWGKNAKDAELEACDLNGNGLIETNDTAILFMPKHWGKSDTKITLP